MVNETKTKEINDEISMEKVDDESTFYNCNDDLKNIPLTSCDDKPGLKATEPWEDEEDDGKTLVKKKLFDLDTFLGSWCDWSYSSLLTDRGLKLLQYTLWILSHYYMKKKKEVLGSSLRKFYSEINNTRYMLRLYGLPVALEGVRTGSWSGGNDWKNAWIYRLADLSAWSMLFYYPFEHAAFATWMVPRLLGRRINANKASAISCRFWLMYIVCEWISCLLKNKELREKLVTYYDKDSGDSSNDSQKIDVKAIQKSISLNRLQILRNALFTLPCLNWSLPKWDSDPLLSEFVTNSLMWGESIVCFYQSVRSRQKN